MILYICILVLIFLFFLLYKIKNPPLFLKYNNNISDVTFKTGDLLFLSGNTKGEKFIKSFLQFEFSHVALCYVHENDVYLLECDMGSKKRNGSRIIKLKNKLKRKFYDNIIGYRPCIQPLNINTLILHKKMDRFFLAYLFYRIDNSINTCSEYICNLLKENNIINKNIKLHKISPKHLYYDFNNIYKKPILLNNDY